MRRGIFWLVSGGLAVLIAAAALRIFFLASPPVQPVPQESAAAPPPAAAPAAAPAASADQAPSFDIVKVNPEGRAVIAGRAAPGARVRVLDGDHSLGEVTADRRGEWVLVPDAPIARGERQITLEATDPQTGKVLLSTETVALSVAPPAPGGANRTFAVLLPGDAQLPARALQVPEGAAVVTAAPAAPGETQYVVKRGNSLWWIAQRTYGAGLRYRIIYSANRDHIHDPNLIYPGQTVTLPKS